MLLHVVEVKITFFLNYSLATMLVTKITCLIIVS